MQLNKQDNIEQIIDKLHSFDVDKYIKKKAADRKVLINKIDLIEEQLSDFLEAATGEVLTDDELEELLAYYDSKAENPLQPLLGMNLKTNNGHQMQKITSSQAREIIPKVLTKYAHGENKTSGEINSLLNKEGYEIKPKLLQYVLGSLKENTLENIPRKGWKLKNGF